jgi:DNA-binding MarR family transcriptional regulator
VPEFDPHLAVLLRDAYRAFDTEVLRRLAHAGYADLRLPHAALAEAMDDDGTRQSVLVERTGLTAQAVSQLIEDFVAKGYLARRGADGDRRANLIVWTERGARAREIALGLIAELEEEYARRLGAGRYEAFRRELGALPDGFCGGAEGAAAEPRVASSGRGAQVRPADRRALEAERAEARRKLRSQRRGAADRGL